LKNIFDFYFNLIKIAIAKSTNITHTAIKNMFIISAVVKELSSTEDIEETCVDDDDELASVPVVVTSVVSLVEFVVFVSFVALVVLSLFFSSEVRVVAFVLVDIKDVLLALSTAKQLKFKQNTDIIANIIDNFNNFFIIKNPLKNLVLSFCMFI
jgi:hypothetical protein